MIDAKKMMSKVQSLIIELSTYTPRHQHLRLLSLCLLTVHDIPIT